MRVRERILAKFWRASRAEFNLRARSLYGIGAENHFLDQLLTRNPLKAASTVVRFPPHERFLLRIVCRMEVKLEVAIVKGLTENNILPPA